MNPCASATRGRWSEAGPARDTILEVCLSEKGADRECESLLKRCVRTTHSMCTMGCTICTTNAQPLNLCLGCVCRDRKCSEGRCGRAAPPCPAGEEFLHHALLEGAGCRRPLPQLRQIHVHLFQQGCDGGPTRVDEDLHNGARSRISAAGFKTGSWVLDIGISAFKHGDDTLDATVHRGTRKRGRRVRLVSIAAVGCRKLANSACTDWKPP